MFDELAELYQELILDHSKRPRNFRIVEGHSHTAEGHNPLCGDNVRIYLLLADGVIKDISFQGSGCAISKASASILTESLKGKNMQEVRHFFDRVHELVTTGKGQVEDLGKLAAFAGVHKFPARVKCAILPWHALLSAVEGRGDKVSTE